VNTKLYKWIKKHLINKYNFIGRVVSGTRVVFLLRDLLRRQMAEKRLRDKKVKKLKDEM